MQRRCNSDEIGQIWTKSKEIEEIPQFYHGKGNFLRTERQTDGDISALRAGVPQISVHQNMPFMAMLFRCSWHGGLFGASAPRGGLLVAPVLRGSGAVATRPTHSSTRALFVRASLHRLGLRVGVARKQVSASLPPNLPEEVFFLAGYGMPRPHARPPYQKK